MPIAVDPSGPPPESPLGGATPGIAVSGLLQRLGDNLGYNTTNPRFRAAMISCIQDTLMEIQLADPMLRRVLVMDAAFTLEAGTDTYDVRQAPFSWTNCYAVNMLKFPELQDRVLEAVTPEQHRHRGVLAGDEGEPTYFVKLDQFRVKIVPPPSDTYAGRGDYQQDIPQIANPDDRVDWPRAWDVLLLEGCMYRGYRWRSEQDDTWLKQRSVFKEMLTNMKTTEAVTTRTPGRVVIDRARRRAIIPHDNSADIRNRR